MMETVARVVTRGYDNSKQITSCFFHVFVPHYHAGYILVDVEQYYFLESHHV